jgi:hypothetical protein
MKKFLYFERLITSNCHIRTDRENTKPFAKSTNQFKNILSKRLKNMLRNSVPRNDHGSSNSQNQIFCSFDKLSVIYILDLRRIYNALCCCFPLSHVILKSESDLHKMLAVWQILSHQFSQRRRTSIQPKATHIF